MDFIAIDVETANADMASICQIGLVKYKGGWGAIYQLNTTQLTPKSLFQKHANYYLTHQTRIIYDPFSR